MENPVGKNISAPILQRKKLERSRRKDVALAVQSAQQQLTRILEENAGPERAKDIFRNRADGTGESPRTGNHRNPDGGNRIRESLILMPPTAAKCQPNMLFNRQWPDGP